MKDIAAQPMERAANWSRDPGPQRGHGPTPIPSTPVQARLAVAGFVLLMAGLGGLALASPEWLIPGSAAAASHEVREAGIRLSMVRERQRIETFVQRSGRLPETLAEAGGVAEGIRYRPSPDGSYQLEADVGRSYVRLASTGSVQAFLGNSLQVILNRPAP
jgi:hypothetical protein